MIPHPYTDIREYAAPVAKAATGDQSNTQQEAPEDAGSPQPDVPPPPADNGGDQDGEPDHPLRWPKDDREWAHSTLEGKTGFHLRMTVIQVYEGLGEDFFKLSVPFNTDGDPYRGPREWLVKYDDEQILYLRDLMSQLYPGGSMQPPSQETVRRLWPECPVQKGYICPFCFASRAKEIRPMAAFHNLHNHVLEMTEKEAKHHCINSPERVHDPEIFVHWNLYVNRRVAPKSNPRGMCDWCKISFGNYTK